MSRGGRLAAGGQLAGSTALGGPQHIIMAAPLTAVPAGTHREQNKLWDLVRRQTARGR